MVAIEDNIRTEVMSIKPLPKFMKRLGQDGNMYGNLWALRLYDEKIETEVNVVISQDYNEPLFEQMNCLTTRLQIGDTFLDLLTELVWLEKQMMNLSKCWKEMKIVLVIICTIHWDYLF